MRPQRVKLRASGVLSLTSMGNALKADLNRELEGACNDTTQAHTYRFASARGTKNVYVEGCLREETCLAYENPNGARYRDGVDTLSSGELRQSALLLKMRIGKYIYFFQVGEGRVRWTLSAK